MGIKYKKHKIRASFPCHTEAEGVLWGLPRLFAWGASPSDCNETCAASVRITVNHRK